MAPTRTSSTRCNDFIYDPLFTVSGEKDYYKAAMVSRISNAKFAVCPIFANMFSDHPNHPSRQVVMRRVEPIPEYSERFAPKDESRPIDVSGVDRHRFFHSSVAVPRLNLSSLAFPSTPSTPKSKTLKQSRKVQTQFRESSAQTVPWEPNYITFATDPKPELLMLDFLKWGSGLPAGMHQVRLIERARMKRAWEKALPPITDAASLEKRRRIIEAMERDEWAFREQEIQDVQNLRLELLEKMLIELHEKSKNRTEQKLKSFCDMKHAEKDEKIKALRHKAERELRKLELKQRGAETKYRPVDVIQEHVDRKSELYAPMARHGEHPKRWNYVIDEHLKKYRAQFIGVEEIDTLPRWLDRAVKIKDCACTKLPGTRLCMRETKWTTPVLKQLHDDLKNLRKKTEHKPCTLLEQVTPEPSELYTPEVEATPDWEEEVYQASVFVQRVLRGRASQAVIFEGRDRCKELIQELRSTHAVQDEDRVKKFKQRLEVKSQQRQHEICLKNVNVLQEMLTKLSGSVVGTLLDFLNKELRRLLEERRAHAMCLLFERERHMREAAEAGRRQAEIRRHLEHDEIFKQVVKFHQDTVDLYLQDIIIEGMEFASETEARSYVETTAKKIDEEAYESLKSDEYQEKEEIVANLVHNFLLPEIEKQTIRERIKKKQQAHLRTVHAAIFDEIENLTKPEPEATGSKISKVHNKEEEQVVLLPKAAPIRGARKIQQGEILGHAVCISGFADIDLPETREKPNVKVIYKEPDTDTMDSLSRKGSVMSCFDKETTQSPTNMHDVDEELFIPLTAIETNLHLETLEAQYSP